MNLIDHVLNIRILIHRALEAQMERGGMDETEREEKLKPCVFTLFNRLAAIKLMEQKELFPEVIKQRAENGGLSAAHQAWLEEYEAAVKESAAEEAQDDPEAQEDEAN